MKKIQLLPLKNSVSKRKDRNRAHSTDQVLLLCTDHPEHSSKKQPHDYPPRVFGAEIQAGAQPNSWKGGTNPMAGPEYIRDLWGQATFMSHLSHIYPHHNCRGEKGGVWPMKFNISTLWSFIENISRSGSISFILWQMILTVGLDPSWDVNKNRTYNLAKIGRVTSAVWFLSRSHFSA